MYWIIAALAAIFGVALLARTGRIPGTRPARPPRVPRLQPGQRYDTTVKLVTFPNVPIADLWRQRLKEHGIEAFYKGGSPVAGIYGTNLDAALPAELWVGEHDAERARELLRELG